MSPSTSFGSSSGSTMASPLHNSSPVSNSEETSMQDEAASLLQDLTSCQPQLSDKLMHPTTRHCSTNCIPDHECISTVTRHHQDRAGVDSKNQSRISDCAEGTSSCQDLQVDADILTNRRNVDTSSSEQRTSASSAGPDAREDLRRLLASLSTGGESGIEERIRNLERDNSQMLLEVWRLKLELARVRRKLRSKLFTVKMEKIMENLKF